MNKRTNHWYLFDIAFRGAVNVRKASLRTWAVWMVLIVGFLVAIQLGVVRPDQHPVLVQLVLPVIVGLAIGIPIWRAKTRAARVPGQYVAALKAPDPAEVVEIVRRSMEAADAFESVVTSLVTWARGPGKSLPWKRTTPICAPKTPSALTGTAHTAAWSTDGRSNERYAVRCGPSTTSTFDGDHSQSGAFAPFGGSWPGRWQPATSSVWPLPPTTPGAGIACTARNGRRPSLRSSS